MRPITVPEFAGDKDCTLPRKMTGASVDGSEERRRRRWKCHQQKSKERCELQRKREK